MLDSNQLVEFLISTQPLPVYRLFVYSAIYIAVPKGLEPSTSCVTGRHSNQLNYGTKVLHLIGLGIIVTIPVRDNATNPRCLIYLSFLVELGLYHARMRLQTTIVAL